MNLCFQALQSTTWVAPYTGKYVIVCVGGGGNGGEGVAAVNTSSNFNIYAIPPTSGAAGGVAIAVKELTANDVLNITISDAKTASITYSGSTVLTASAGGAGSDGKADRFRSSPGYSIHTTVPSGGTASGSWLTLGFSGGPGRRYTDTTIATKAGTRHYDSLRGGDVTITHIPSNAGSTAGFGYTPTASPKEIDNYAGYSTSGGKYIPTAATPTELAISQSYAGGGGASGSVSILDENTSANAYTSITGDPSGGKGGIALVNIFLSI